MAARAPVIALPFSHRGRQSSPAAPPPPPVGFAGLVARLDPLHYWRLDGAPPWPNTGRASGGRPVMSAAGTATPTPAPGLVAGDTNGAQQWGANARLSATLAAPIPQWSTHAIIRGGVGSDLIRNVPTGTYISLFRSSSANVVRVFAQPEGSNLSGDVPAAAATALNAFVLTYDGASVRLYRDGALVGGWPIAGRAMVAGDFRIGELMTGANTATFDEVAIWDRALTATEIADLWAAAI